MAGDTQITVVGNLVSDPELRYTPTGVAVANFRVASTPRTFDRQANEWKDGDSLFLTCNVWRQAAENVAESLQRGMRVVVMGRLHQRSYETREGEKRTVFEVEVDDVGPSLRNASAKVTRSNRSGGAAVAAAAASAAAVLAAAAGGWRRRLRRRRRPGWLRRVRRVRRRPGQRRPLGQRLGRLRRGRLRRTAVLSRAAAGRPGRSPDAGPGTNR